MYTELEKTILKQGIGNMLEAGQTYNIIETAEIIGDILDPDGYKIVHKAFCVQINKVFDTID